jgi:hypothetical protein
MKTWHSMDKTGWKPGPWIDEADKAQWIDPETNLDCLIVRSRSGALCGYVGISCEHPFYEKHYDKIPEINEPHGGLTYADFCQEEMDPSKGICHIPENERPVKVWWFGFDCAHFSDYIPVRYSMFSVDWESPCIYRDFDYVKSEVELLAKSLRNAEKSEK